MVMESIRDNEANLKELIQLQRLYKKQNLDSIEILLKNEKKSISKHENLFLKNRNNHWIPKILKSIENECSFIAVGAAHLIGKDGLIQLLKNEGYTLIPIKI